MQRLVHLSEFLRDVLPQECIVIHSGAAHPTVLARQLAESAHMLRGHYVHTLLPYGPIPYAQAPARDHLELSTFLPGAGLRPALDAGRLHAMRQPLSEAPRLFNASNPVGAVLLRVSTPDEAGRVSLGVAVDYMPAALRVARQVVAEVDPAMPRTAGDAWLNVGSIDAFVDAVDGPHEVLPAQPDIVDEAIAGHVAGLVDDGAVLQLGVGSLPDQVLAKLGHLKHLGLHTGIIGDGARALIERGTIDNSTKEVLPGVCVATMAVGTRDFYRFMDRNPAIELHPCSVTHSQQVLRRLGCLHAINSALQVDLHGRVNAEWAGSRQVSLPGGLPDFSRAAAALAGGRSIIALRACDRKGRSAIVADLPAERSCSLQPSEVDCYVTEYGVAAVRGGSADDRRKALIAIAHPEHRGALMRA
ncbi:MAG TPA: acetyl-CoA hydrolase/transferase C-terminal domain-containing protein [Bordetella sp.]|nr:acetyl-CoA hydrolase/transferase C-terminal domain-containing protein [Bordetella sp.]